MKRQKHTDRGWVKRPQLWVVVLTVAFVGLGVWLALRRPGPLQPVAVQTPSGQAIPFASSLPEAPSTASQPNSPIDCGVQACLALTFDDGPDADFTPRILDTLKRHHVQATFFVVGLHAQRHPDLIRREFLDGHEIGNHSWDHADFTKLRPAQIREEIFHTQQVISAANVPVPTIFRPPYGAINDVVMSNVPLSVVRWNIDPEDWNVKQPKNIVDHLSSTVKPGGVIILHDTEQYTAEALDSLLQQLEGTYHFVTVSDLLNLPPGQPGLFFGR